MSAKAGHVRHPCRITAHNRRAKPLHVRAASARAEATAGADASGIRPAPASSGGRPLRAPVDAPSVSIPYAREFPHPVDAAYAWLTDYQDDAVRARRVVVLRRPVLERHPDRVVLDATVDIVSGEARSRVEVALHPPDRWVATVVGGRGRGTVYEYRLAPTATGCRLHVDYRFRVKRLRAWLALHLLRRRVYRHLDRMWDGFAAAMEREIRA